MEQEILKLLLQYGVLGIIAIFFFKYSNDDRKEWREERKANAATIASFTKNVEDFVDQQRENNRIMSDISANQTKVLDQNNKILEIMTKLVNK